MNIVSFASCNTICWTSQLVLREPCWTCSDIA